LFITTCIEKHCTQPLNMMHFPKNNNSTQYIETATSMLFHKQHYEENEMKNKSKFSQDIMLKS